MRKKAAEADSAAAALQAAKQKEAADAAAAAAALQAAKQRKAAEAALHARKGRMRCNAAPRQARSAAAAAAVQEVEAMGQQQLQQRVVPPGPPDQRQHGRRCRDALSAVSRGLLGAMRTKPSGLTGVQKRGSSSGRQQRLHSLAHSVVLAFQAQLQQRQQQQQRLRQLLRSWREQCQRPAVPHSLVLEDAASLEAAAAVPPGGGAGTAAQAACRPPA